MSETFITPRREFSYCVAEPASCSVSVPPPDGAVYATSGNVPSARIRCGFAIQGDRDGLSMLPSTRPVWSSTIWA